MDMWEKKRHYETNPEIIRTAGNCCDPVGLLLLFKKCTDLGGS